MAQSLKELPATVLVIGALVWIVPSVIFVLKGGHGVEGRGVGVVGLVLVAVAPGIGLLWLAIENRGRFGMLPTGLFGFAGYMVFVAGVAYLRYVWEGLLTHPWYLLSNVDPAFVWTVTAGRSIIFVSGGWAMLVFAVKRGDFDRHSRPPNSRND